MIVEVPDVIIIYIDRVEIVVLIVEPLEEILIIQILLNCPSSFCNGDESWEDHVFNAILSDDSF